MFFWKAASNLISSYPMSWYLIMPPPKKKTMGFQIFKREKFLHPWRGLGLQAFGLGGDHCEGRLFSWSLDRGPLTSGVPPSVGQGSRGGIPPGCPPSPKNHWGKQIQMKNGKYMEISGDFSMGKTKKTAGGMLKYITPGLFVTHHLPSSLQNFPWTKKILPIFELPRSWRNPLVMECQSAAMHVVDFMRWSITLAVPISMSTGNMRDESGTKIRWFFCWVRFLGGIQSFWGG